MESILLLIITICFLLIFIFIPLYAIRKKMAENNTRPVVIPVRDKSEFDDEWFCNCFVEPAPQRFSDRKIWNVEIADVPPEESFASAFGSDLLSGYYCKGYDELKFNYYTLQKFARIGSDASLRVDIVCDYLKRQEVIKDWLFIDTLPLMHRAIAYAPFIACLKVESYLVTPLVGGGYTLADTAVGGDGWIPVDCFVLVYAVDEGLLCNDGTIGAFLIRYQEQDVWIPFSKATDIFDTDCIVAVIF